MVIKLLSTSFILNEYLFGFILIQPTILRQNNYIYIYIYMDRYMRTNVQDFLFEMLGRLHEGLFL